MVGMHPSHKRPHINYETEMAGSRRPLHVPHDYHVHRGTSPALRTDKVDASCGTTFKKGGSTHHNHHRRSVKMAIGGVGKIRHREASRRGLPLRPPRISRG